MFENYSQLNADEKAQIKAIHKALRAETPSRERNLAWGFVRGLKYRRIERTTRSQTMPDGSIVNHNEPSLVYVAKLLAKHIPGLEGWFKGSYTLAQDCPLIAWMADPSGAIPAPVRPKKPFVPTAEVA
jgi:hypothetical protein